MKLITCPPHRERGGVEIRYDPRRIGVKPDVFLSSRGMAYTFFRIVDGKELATVPYEDRDAIFSLAEDVQFGIWHVGRAVVHYHRSFQRRLWNFFSLTTDLEIKFLTIPSI
ncbi:MAG TPA: hypothetical protein VMU13_03385 [Candidatus Paceibacterota bacterium]|nr:hypothetical protein [Candidatus Paceibacterota bacterium]